MRVRFGRLYEPLRSSEQKVLCKDSCAAPKTLSSAVIAFLSLQGWNELPQDLVQRILECSTTEQGWSARQVSRCWAKSARQTCRFQAVVPCKCSNFLSEMENIVQQRLAQRLHGVSFTLVFTEPASFAELAELLNRVVSQVCVSKCPCF